MDAAEKAIARAHSNAPLTRPRTTHRLDLRTGSWSRVANLLLARCYVSAVALEGKVYALGGFDGVTRTRTVETFDPEGNKWEAAPSMRVIRWVAWGSATDGLGLFV